MRKRLLALTIALAFVLALVPFAFMAEIGVGQTSTPAFVKHYYGTNADIKIDDVSLRAFGLATATSYAFLTADAAPTGTANPKLSWKAAGKAVLVNQEMDISKIAAKGGFLFISNLDVNATKVDAGSWGSATSFAASDIAVFQIIKQPATKPVIAKGDITYTNDEVIIDKFSVASNLEWTYAEDVNNWQKETSGKLILPLMPYKQDIWVRIAATADSAPSVSVKVSIAALGNAPAAKLDMAKGLVKAKGNWLIWNPKLGEFSTVTSINGNNAKGDITLAQLEAIECYPGSTLEFIIPATGAKPGTSIGYLFMPYDQAGEGPINVYDDLFVISSKNTVVISGLVPVEFWEVKGTATAWKKAKAFKIDGAENPLFGAGIKVRFAGTKSMWPSSAEYTVKIVNGELVVDDFVAD